MPASSLSAPPEPEVAPDALAALLDDPAEWAAFSQPLPGRSGVWESFLVMQGMHCAACAITLEDVLQGLPGVQEAAVSAGSHRARVVWTQERTRPSAWLRAVQQAGYAAVPAHDAFANLRRRQETRKALWRWLVAGLCMMQVMMYAWPAYVAAPGDLTPEMAQLLRWASWVLSLPVIFFSCGPFFSSALRDVWQRRISMDLPVALGILITFAVSTAGTFEPQGIFGREVYFDSLTMFVFFLLTGRWLELRLRDRTAGALDALMNRLPDTVQRQTVAGDFERVTLRHLQVGDVIQVLPGDVFAADGVLTQGHTHVDEALLTGEAEPLARAEGERVIAGSYNLTARVQVRVERVARDTRFSQIVALMEAAAVSKPDLARLVDRLAKPFLWGVLLCAMLAVVLWWPQDPGHALMVAVAVLVVTCPCALSLATPAAMLAAAGMLARRGVLVRRLGALEALAAVDTLVFDKTGTLTRDAMAVESVQTRGGLSEPQAWAMAAALAQHSLHPVSRALATAARAQGVAVCSAQAIQEQAGQGVQGAVSCEGDPNPPRTVRLGSPAFCGLAAVQAPGLQVCLADEQGWLATFSLAEALRPQARPTLEALRTLGLELFILSGDRSAAVQNLAQSLPVPQALGGCSPQDKLAFLQQAQKTGKKVAMVGDGLNDGPVLAGAHVSFAFGLAVPLARAQADLVILGDDLSAVLHSVQLARRTMRVVRQNLRWAVAYNAVCVPLALGGWMPAWLAGFGMAASSLLVVLNALRLSRGRPGWA